MILPGIHTFKDKTTASRMREELIKIYRKIPTHLINVIEYNPVAGTDFMKPNEERTRLLRVSWPKQGQCKGQKEPWQGYRRRLRATIIKTKFCIIFSYH